MQVRARRLAALDLSLASALVSYARGRVAGLVHAAERVLVVADLASAQVGRTALFSLGGAPADEARLAVRSVDSYSTTTSFPISSAKDALVLSSAARKAGAGVAGVIRAAGLVFLSARRAGSKRTVGIWKTNVAYRTRIRSRRQAQTTGFSKRTMLFVARLASGAIQVGSVAVLLLRASRRAGDGRIAFVVGHALP